MPSSARGPRAQHPVLLPLTEAEAVRLARAAKLCEMTRAAFIRDAALSTANDVIADAKGGRR